MKWTMKEPEEAGWYWAMFYNYEYPEPVFFTGNTIYVSGQVNQPSSKTVWKWSDSKIVPPQES